MGTLCEPLQLFCKFQTILKLKVYLKKKKLTQGRRGGQEAGLSSGKRREGLERSPGKWNREPEKLPFWKETGIPAPASLRKWLPTNQVSQGFPLPAASRQIQS